MEVYRLKDNLHVFCVRAKSFPNDIKQAFGDLIGLLPSTDDRTFFGLSHQDERGKMIYHAAVLESFRGESRKYGCESLVIEKGDYLAELLKGWKKNEASIGKTFRKLSESRSDLMFPFVEWYKGDDVLCMVRIEKSNSK